MPELEPALSSFIDRLPKVELHLHLEGAVRPETLLELSQNKSGLRQKVDEWITARREQRFRYGNFQEFLVAFKLVTLLIETPQDYALATTRLIEWLAEQNVQYAEIIFAAGVVLWKKQPVDAVFEAVAAAAEEAEARTGVRVKWIFDAIRHFGVDHAREVMHWAARYRSRGVVGFGIGGDEAGGPAKLFPDIFREARDLGLHVVAHAGEACGPESIRDAVELLGAERIGHGLTAIRDPNVMALLRERTYSPGGLPQQQRVHWLDRAIRRSSAAEVPGVGIGGDAQLRRSRPCSGRAFRRNFDGRPAALSSAAKHWPGYAGMLCTLRS